MPLDTTRNADKLPWKDEISNTLWYRAFRECGDDGKVGRYLFVIKDKNGSGLPYAIHNCMLLALAHKHDGWDNYLISIPVGPDAGQEINQYYVELKPVRKNDAAANMDG